MDAEFAEMQEMGKPWIALSLSRQRLLRAGPAGTGRQTVAGPQQQQQQVAATRSVTVRIVTMRPSRSNRPTAATEAVTECFLSQGTALKLSLVGLVLGGQSKLGHDNEKATIKLDEADELLFHGPE